MKKKVLIVDDNIAMTDMLKEYFSSHTSVEVKYEAHNGEEAWNIIKDSYSSIDVVLLD